MNSAVHVHDCFGYKSVQHEEQSGVRHVIGYTGASDRILRTRIPKVRGGLLIYGDSRTLGNSSRRSHHMDVSPRCSWKHDVGSGLFAGCGQSRIRNVKWP